jgi:DnaJ family protein B protein 4
MNSFVDHYDVLGLSQDVSHEDIKMMYKKLCLIYHPDKITNEKATEKFKSIQKAYEVLSNESSRINYDKNYEYFNRNIQQNRVKYKSIYNLDDNDEEKSPPIICNLEVSLEVLLTGRLIRKKLEKTIALGNGKCNTVEKYFEVHVRPGWKSGTRLTFHREGNQEAGKIPGDVIFMIKEKPHEKFIRDGNDLKYKVEISQRQREYGTTLEIPTLSGEIISYKLEKRAVNEGTIQRFHGYGLPYSKEHNRSGDLLVHFEIVPNSRKEDLASCCDDLRKKCTKFLIVSVVMFAIICIIMYLSQQSLKA